MKKVLIALVILCFCVCQAAAEQTIIMRVADWPPLYYKGLDGNWTGMSVDIGKAVIEAAGFRTTFAEIHWEGAINRIRKGDIHLMMNLSRTDERSEFLHWLGVEDTAHMVLIVKEENLNLGVHNLEDLVKVCTEQKKKFGIQGKVFYGDNFQRRMETDETFRDCFEPIDKAVLNMNKTLGNRILGFFEQELPIRYRIKTDPTYRGLAIHPFVLTRATAYIGVSRKGVDEATLSRLQQGYEKVVGDGTLERIKVDWKKRLSLD